MQKIKEAIKNMPKKLVAFIMAFAILANYFFPITAVFAVGGNVIFDGYTAIEDNNAKFNVTLGEKNFQIYMWLEVDEEVVELASNGSGQVDDLSQAHVYAEIDDGEEVATDYAGKIGIDLAGNRVTFTSTKVKVGEGENDFYYAYSLQIPAESTQFMVRAQDIFYEPGNPEPDPSETPTEPEDINVSFTFTGTTGVVQINDKNVAEEGNSGSSLVQKAGTTDSTKTNSIRISTSYGAPKFSKVTINGVDYTFTDSSDIHTVIVPGALSYTITGTADNSLAVDRTIIWANVDANKNADEFEEDMLLEHGSAKVVAVYDGDKKVAGEADVDKNGMGWVSVDPGNKVVFEFVPEYGYQLTSVKANGMPLESQDTTNQYVFTMPNTNVHFSAEFTKTEDIVKANSEKVASGSIKLGGALDGGSAQLTIGDVELSADKIAGFEKAAGEYTISNYLDIDLYNVFYKGKNDANDVWSNKISELDDYATITIKLEDGVNANDIAIVHNIHDGDEYEIIEIDSYDAETNTITFKTKSFSNYAIATKAGKKSSPKTSDRIYIWFSLFLIAAVGFVIAKVKTKREA